MEPCNRGAHSSDRQHAEVEDVGGVVIRTDDPDGQIHPDEEESGRERESDRKAIRVAAHLLHDHFEGQPGTEDERTGHDEVEGRPVHLVAEPHRDERHGQESRRDRGEADEDPSRGHDQHSPFPEDSGERLGEEPQCIAEQALASGLPFPTEVLEGLLHAFGEPHAKALWVHPEQDRVEPPVGERRPVVSHARSRE